MSSLSAARSPTLKLLKSSLSFARTSAFRGFNSPGLNQHDLRFLRHFSTLETDAAMGLPDQRNDSTTNPELSLTPNSCFCCGSSKTADAKSDTVNTFQASNKSNKHNDSNCPPPPGSLFKNVVGPRGDNITIVPNRSVQQLFFADGGCWGCGGSNESGLQQNMFVIRFDDGGASRGLAEGLSNGLGKGLPNILYAWPERGR